MMKTATYYLCEEEQTLDLDLEIPKLAIEVRQMASAFRQL